MQKIGNKIKPGIYYRIPVAFLKGWLLLLLLCRIFPAHAQYKDEWYLKKVLDNSNGLLQNSVISMYFDKKTGFLWMTTEAGIVRYDGIESFIFDKRMLPGMKTVRMSVFLRNANEGVVAIDRSGRIYNIKEATVSEYKKDSIDAPSYLNGPFKGGFLDIAHANEVINNLKTLADGRYDFVSSPLPVITLGGRNWASYSYHSLKVYNDRTITDSFPKSEKEAPVLFNISDRLYALNEDGSGYFYDPVKKEFKKINCRDTVFLQGKPRIFYDQLNGQSFVLNGDKLYSIRFSGEEIKIEFLARLAGLPNNISSIIIHPDGNLIFIGTQLNGLFIYARNAFRTYKAEGDQHIAGRMSAARNNIYANVLPDTDHVLTSSSVLFNLKNGSYSVMPFVNERVSTMLLDRNGIIWYAFGDTIKRFRYSTGEHFKDLRISLTIYRAKRGQNFLKSLYESSSGRIWVSTSEYLGYMDHDSIIPYYLFSSNSNNNLSPDCITETASGTLICASGRGLFYADPEKRQLVPFKNAKVTEIRSLRIEPNGYCWITTYGNGIFMYDMSKDILHNFPVDPKGYLLFSHAFCDDGAGNFLIPTNRGIFRINRNDLLQYSKAPTGNIFYQYFDTNTGLEGNEFNGGCEPTYIRHPDGDVLFPSLSGLVKVNVRLLPDPTAYPIFISRAETRDSSYRYDSEYHFSSGERSMIWYLNFAEWGQEYSPGLSYRLDDDSSWIYLPGGARSIRLSEISSGDHVLHIHFRAGFSPQTASSLDVPFYIEKKYFEHAWFWLLCLLLLAGFFYLGLRLKTRNLGRKTINLEKKVNEKTKELVEKNEELNTVLVDLRKSNYLKSSLINLLGHDIIVPLRYMGKITRHLKEQDRNISRERLMENIGDIHLTAIQLQLFGESIIHWIKVQNKQFKPLAEQFKPADIIKELEAFYQPFCTEKNNTLLSEPINDNSCVQDPVLVRILIHNLLLNANKFTSGGEIRVKAGVEKDRLLISIADTGRGMSKEKMDSLNNYRPVDSEEGTELEKGWGIGYTIIMDLLSFSNGTLHVESEPGKGTTVTISLPAEI